MKVSLYQAWREIEVKGPKAVKALVYQVDLVSVSEMVIRAHFPGGTGGTR